MKIISSIAQTGKLCCDYMYPSQCDVISNSTFKLPKFSTVYGVVISGKVHISDRHAKIGEAFSLNSSRTDEVCVEGKAVFFTRYGFIGQNVLGVGIEDRGRIQYIDTCTDSILIYPPRKGDPCLNSLHFPRGVDQTFHTHPTVRFGVVVEGKGLACFQNETYELSPGDVFMIEPHEVHRFSTRDSLGMVVVAYHPDSDFGPTDENHPMKNRTYIS